ncbi:MAG: GntR family transcriptional regulator [Eubacteriales bacterium]|nr:GntR family transcriptional regulator [Eubacteriales bacterium]
MRDHRTISIADQIFDQLQDEILSGKYKKGEILSEVKLSEELGVSRTPVREAVRRLEQDHILHETSKGIVVVGISNEDMLDMYDIRIQLEGQAAARAAENITDEQLAELHEIVDLQKFYIDKPDDYNGKSNSIKDLDSRFHEIFYLATGSVVYFDTLFGIHKKITKFRKASLSETGRAQKSYEEHVAIIAALEAHEPELARARTIRHIINARDSIKKKIFMETNQAEK